VVNKDFQKQIKEMKRKEKKNTPAARYALRGGGVNRTLLL